MPMDYETRVRTVDRLVGERPSLYTCREAILQAAEHLIRCYTRGGTVFSCGNGGSAADSGHIVGELMKGFRRSRPINTALRESLARVDAAIGEGLAEMLQGALSAVDLTAQTALTTAFINDRSGDAVYAQQVVGYGSPEDLLIALSTSGNSTNIVYAAVAAQAVGMSVVGMTGSDGGKLAQYCDVTIRVPETDTAGVQELHLPVYHTLCSIAEEHFFPE